MKIDEFKRIAKTYMPIVDVENVYSEMKLIKTPEWSVYIYQFAETENQPAMVEVHIQYIPADRLKAKSRCMNIGMWAYKLKNKDWIIHNPYKMW